MQKELFVFSLCFRISEHIESSRRNIEKELKEVAKLSQWELRQCYLSIENSRRIRQKILKLIQKFSVMISIPNSKLSLLSCFTELFIFKCFSMVF